jgi:hypothetical protein
MNTPELNRESYTDNVIFISGIGRSGKSLLLPIVSSFQNAEKVNVNYFLELITGLHSTNEVSDDLAVYLLRSGMNIMVYDNAIGRNTNFRKNDYTSAWKFKEPIQYISRLAEEDGDRVFDKIEKENNIFPVMWHNGLWHAKILLDAFPKSKIIHVQRNPIDIVYSWMGKGYGGEFYTNKRSSDSLVYKYQNEIIPHFAIGWEDDYINLSGVDRIIYMIDKIRKKHLDSFNGLSKLQKNQILFISFEKLTLSTSQVIPEVTNFLNTQVSEFTSKILLDERCPRKYDPQSKMMKLNAIQAKVSKLSFELLMNMNKDFEENDIVI